MNELPKYKQYTIDYKLKEMRRVDPKEPRSIEFIPFDSIEGQQVLKEMADLQEQWIGPDQCIDDEGHVLRDAVMTEDGIDYPIRVCTKCKYWG